MADAKALRSEYITVGDFEHITVVAGAARRSITAALSKFKSIAIADKDSPALPGDLIEIELRGNGKPQVAKVVKVAHGHGKYRINLWVRTKNKRTNKFGRVVKRIPGETLMSIKKL